MDTNFSTFLTKYKGKITVILLALILALTAFFALTINNTQNRVEANANEWGASFEMSTVGHGVDIELIFFGNDFFYYRATSIAETSIVFIGFASHTFWLDLPSIRGNQNSFLNNPVRYTFRQLYQQQFGRNFIYASYLGANLFISISVEVAHGNDDYAVHSSNLIPITLPVPLPPDPSPPVGHYFAGWYLDASFNTPLPPNYQITQDTELHARFNPISYTITFMLNGGQHAVIPPTTFTILTSTITLPNSTRHGFDFNGWYNNPSFTGTPQTQIPIGTIGNQRFYARWTARPYTITVNLNGGNLATSVPATYTIQSPIIVIPNPTRNGFTFNGWYNNPQFTGTQTASITTGSTGNRSFYARWTVIEFSINFGLNGGEFTDAPPTTFTIEHDLIALPTPTRHGFNFVGWFTNSTFTGNTVTGINAGSTGNRTFFAQWELQTFTVTFFVGGVVFTEIIVPFGSVLADFSLVNPATQQAVELFVNAELTTEFDPLQGIYGATTVFATDPFSIQVQLSRNVKGTVTTEMRAVNTYLNNLPTPTLNGYDFVGWFFDSAFTRRVNSTDRLTSNTTIYARFMPTVVDEGSIWDWLTWVLIGVGILLVGLVVLALVKYLRKKRGR